MVAMGKSASSVKGDRDLAEISTENAEPDVSRLQEELEQKTEELANSRVMMRATLESTTDAIVMTDGAANLTGFNEKYVEMMGVSRETINSASVQELREIF